MSTQNQATRTEKDTMGNVEVPADAYWGAQTQRSRENFKILITTCQILLKL